jgi:nitroimidazol reductase NimA-like FMN-containing flavoprotein (pyridoxamine 5'-phosphate oxidase superfamily)
MATWQEFAAAQPELADFAFDRLYERIAYFATVTDQGGPRVHPVSPFFGDGHLYVYMEPTSPKVRDLARDPRFALHGTVENNEGGGGEVILNGRVRLVPDEAGRQAAFTAARDSSQSPEERYVVFELELERVMTTVYPGGKPQRRRWAASLPLSGLPSSSGSPARG